MWHQWHYSVYLFHSLSLPKNKASIPKFSRKVRNIFKCLFKIFFILQNLFNKKLLTIAATYFTKHFNSVRIFSFRWCPSHFFYARNLYVNKFMFHIIRISNKKIFVYFFISITRTTPRGTLKVPWSVAASVGLKCNW